MTINASARKARIYIGEKDFSTCLISFQGSDSHLDQSGLVSFTGKIILGQSLGFDESLDDRKNPYRFARGQSIIIEVANSAGTLQRHPRGALHILSPKYDDETQRLTLDVGDAIALLSFKEPTDPDKANSSSTQTKSASEIIISLLSESGISAISGVLPSTRYDYPLNLSGSYLASVGKLLYANNLFGWINNQGIFCIRQAVISAGTGGINLVIGQEEIWYKRLDGAESPCSVIKAVGTEMIVRPIARKIKTTTEQYGTASSIDKNYGDFVITILKQNKTQTWSKELNKLTIDTENYRPFGSVVPEVFWGTLPPKLQHILAEVVREEYYYEEGVQGKLKYKEIKLYQIRAGFLAEYKKAKPNTFLTGVLGNNLAKWDRITYKYDAKDRLQKISTLTSELEIIILNGTDEDWKSWLTVPEYLIPSAKNEQEWTELNKNTWQYSTFSYEALVRFKPELVTYQAGSKINSNKTNLIYSTGETRASNSGQELPPAPERRPADYSYEENRLEEKALFFGVEVGGVKPRERTFTVDFLASRVEPTLLPGEVALYSTTGSSTAAASQLQAIATREGRLVLGRYKGEQIAGALNDEVFNYYPLFPVQATELDGTIQEYLADGTSWVLSPTRALWSCDGIWVGTRQGSPTGSVILPYTEPFIAYSGLGLGVDFMGYGYSLSPITKIMSFGFGLGIRLEVAQDAWGTIDWDNLDWENI